MFVPVRWAVNPCGPAAAWEKFMFAVALALYKTLSVTVAVSVPLAVGV